MQHARFVESFARFAGITQIATTLDRAHMYNNHLTISNSMIDVASVFKLAENWLRQFPLYTDAYVGGDFFPRHHRRILGRQPIIHVSLSDY